jgi:hypothetical protein
MARRMNQGKHFRRREIRAKFSGRLYSPFAGVPTMRAAAAVMLATVVAASPTMAQVSTEAPPKSIILPNYDMVRLGQLEAIESGAIIAQVTGPLANVYNPAGLASAAKSAVNASSTGYQYTRLGLTGFGREVTSSRFANLGGFLGVVLADPVLKTPKWRLGFSIYSPISWEPGTLSGAETGLISGQERQVDYRTQVRLQVQIPSLSAGVNLSPKIRVGASFQVPIVYIEQQQSVSTLGYDGTAAGQVARDYSGDGSTWNVRAVLGAQWDVTSAVSVGAALSTPTARLWGSSFYQDDITAASGTGFEALTFRDTGARLENKLPLTLSGGVAVKLGKVRIEADVRWYNSIDEWDLYTSDSLGTAVAQEGGAPPAAETVVMTPVTLAYRSVVNVAIGARVPLSRRVEFHAGFNSDQSPLPGTDEIFRKVNLIGATAGLSLTGARLSGSLGVGFQSGTSPETQVGIPPFTRVTEVSVKIVQLLYSISYAF